MSEEKIGEYQYVSPESEAEKELTSKKHPKDRLLSVKRLQNYEVTLQDMFAMRQHYKQESLTALKNAVISLRDYKSGMVQVKTWEEQIMKAMQDIPELADNNTIPESEVVTAEMVKEFEEICAGIESRHNEMAVLAVVPDRGDDNLESVK